VNPLTVLAIIPARGGSKGIPKKNTILLGKKPLLRWTIDAARKSRLLTDMMLSTDSPRIRRLGIGWGCPAPFLRPKALATDKAGTLGVIQHAVRYYEAQSGKTVDAVLILQPTSPFRSSQDIDAAIRSLAGAPAADSVVSFQIVSHGHPNYLYRLERQWIKPYLGAKARIQPRQQFESVYVRNGALYLVRRSILMDHGSTTGKRILPYVMPAERSINIDDRFDLRIAEGLLRVR
jgi:CMP-N,N'-diacetyllegionaminic acid synthase